MKHLNVFLIAILTVCSFACNKSEQTGDVPLEIDGSTFQGSATFQLNTKDSRIEWIGRKTIGDRTHRGTLLFREGQFYIKEGKLVGGTFIMDMTSITDLDMQLGDGKEDLESHLKDEDFFEVEKYPTGRFEIASVFETDSIPGATHMVIGNLTLKEVTKSVKVPARLLVNANHASAMTPSFKINRTEWGINFRSGILGGIAKDAVIEDMIELKLRVRGDLPNTSETVSE